jgi:hypothetical protein
MICPLCSDPSCRELHREAGRRFFLCEQCGLIFVPAADHISADDERRRYSLHDNSAGHDGYVRFLGELARVITDRYTPDDALLDFGCGGEAVLTGMLNEQGFRCTAYDPLYGIGPDALDHSYDLVILCEVIEHVRDLPAEIGHLQQAVKPGGAVIVRTRLYPSAEGFAGWWYKNDSTHVNFFNDAAMAFLAGKLKRGVTAIMPDIFLFRK